MSNTRRIKITLNNLQNQLPVSDKKIKNLVFKVLAGERIKQSGWINICFVDNARIKQFNAAFLHRSAVTDVLAFNLSDQQEKNIILADIMISTQQALIQARQFKTTPDYELSLYVVHAILHILGFNDHTLAQIKLMRKKEKLYVH